MEFDTPNSFYKTKKLRYNQIVNDIQYDTFMLTAEVIKLLNKYEMSTSESAYAKFRANYAKLDFELKDLFRIYRALKFKLFTNPTAAIYNAFCLQFYLYWLNLTLDTMITKYMIAPWENLHHIAGYDND